MKFQIVSDVAPAVVPSVPLVWNEAEQYFEVTVGTFAELLQLVPDDVHHIRLVPMPRGSDEPPVLAFETRESDDAILQAAVTLCVEALQAYAATQQTVGVPLQVPLDGAVRAVQAVGS